VATPVQLRAFDADGDATAATIAALPQTGTLYRATGEGEKGAAIDSAPVTIA
jgi:hypothetical protein